jgi:hypothetical protein
MSIDMRPANGNLYGLTSLTSSIRRARDAPSEIEEADLVISVRPRRRHQFSTHSRNTISNSSADLVC